MYLGTDISDYQGAIWKRLSPGESAIPRQIGRGEDISVRVRAGEQRRRAGGAGFRRVVGVTLLSNGTLGTINT